MTLLECPMKLLALALLAAAPVVTAAPAFADGAVAETGALDETGAPMPEVDTTPQIPALVPAPEVVKTTAAREELFAFATAGNALQEAGIGGLAEGEARAAYWGSYSYIRGSASLLLRGGSDGAGLSFHQDGAAKFAFYVFEPTVKERLTLEVAPSFTDRPDRWRRRYSGAGFNVDVSGIDAWNRHWGVQFIRLENGFDWERQSDASTTAHRYIETIDWSPIAITRRKHGEETMRVDPIVAEGRAIGSEHSGVVLTTFAPRITGIPLGGARLDVATGYAETATTSTSINDQQVVYIDSTQLPKLKVPATRVRLSVPAGPVAITATAERGMFLAQDATLVVEERATLAAATTIDHTEIRAAGFAAHSVIWTSPTDHSEHVTGGGSLAVDIPLEDRWKLTNQAELARTFYASLDGDLLPRVDTALRLDVGLHHELRNWVPK